MKRERAITDEKMKPFSSLALYLSIVCECISFLYDERAKEISGHFFLNSFIETNQTAGFEFHWKITLSAKKCTIIVFLFPA